MTSGHYDSDQALDLILAAGEAEELERVQAGLRLDAGLAAITRGDASEHSPCIDSDDSGEPSILSEAADSRASFQVSVDATNPKYCVLFAVDVAGSARRDERAQLLMRQALYAVLTEAFEDSQVDWDDCLREDRG